MLRLCLTQFDLPSFCVGANAAVAILKTFGKQLKIEVFHFFQHATHLTKNQVRFENDEINWTRIRIKNNTLKIKRIETCVITVISNI